MSLKIGITFNSNVPLWNNGVNQNAIYLANLFNSIGYDTVLIHPKKEDIDKIRDIKTITLDASFNVSFDIVVQLGFAMHQQFYDKYILKNPNIKLVAYECGNKFIMDMEATIFKHDQQNIIEDRAVPDQIWSIPQMENTNLSYYKFINGQDCATVVPFIWEPFSINMKIEQEGYSKAYIPRDLTKIGVLEPNISVMKNSILPMIAIDSAYKSGATIEQVILFSSEKIRFSETFKSLVSKTKLAKDGIMLANARKNTIDVINNMIDFVVSWQWENNLNYLWLELAWLGYPILHNGNLCQDIGYYWEGFSVESAEKQILNILQYHNDNENYLRDNRKNIHRYTHENDNLKKDYLRLIENLVSNKFEKFTYNWQTNSIS